MASVYFADTSFYVALLKPSDSHHPRARAWRDHLSQSSGHLLTTEAVLWEVLNSFAPHATRRRAIAAYTNIHHDRRSRVIGFEPAICSAALGLYETHDDKDWGMVDCLSFEVMRQHGIHDALTTDHHFVQAGFTALLLQDPPA